MSSIPQKCPSCTSPLQVTQLTCTSCGTGVVGSFELSPLLKLSNENLAFLENFVRNRGNVKEMARETGDSYWTIRRRLDEVVQEMGYTADAPSQAALADRRQEILGQLSRGEISVDEAKAQLTALGE